MSVIEEKIDVVLSRGVGEFVDPDNLFREKLLKKARGEYDKDIIVKFGIDPTRPDIHLGHAVVFWKLRELQELGCKAVFVVGDFTAGIGDPSGKSKVRPELEQREIEENMKTYLNQVGAILKTDPLVFSWIRNSDWFYNITDIEAKQGANIKFEVKGAEITVDANSYVGKALLYNQTRMQKTHLGKERIYDVTLRGLLWTLRHITHGRLIERDMFQKRIQSGEALYMHEMLYPVLQGIDSFILTSIYGSCDMEISGTDQTFNVLVGRDVQRINRKTLEKRGVSTDLQAVLSMELLVGTDGTEKMSKSLDNYISITEDAHQMFGKVMSVPDNAMESYFELATDMSQGDIEKIMKEHPRDAKLSLAERIVSRYHGAEKAREARSQFVSAFSKGSIPKDVPEARATKGTSLAEIFLARNVVSSKMELRRLVDSGSVLVLETGEKVTDIMMPVLETNTFKVGKHRFLKIIISAQA